MYDSFYKLKEKPFQLTPDPRYFFDSQGHKRALAYLRYGLNQGEGFIIITGDIGTGKTMLVRTLCRELEGQNIVAGQLVTTQIEADDMLRMVSATFGLPFDGIPKGTLLKTLESYLRTQHSEGKRVLLVVDEVQNLPMSSVEELRMLSNFEEDGKPLLQSFLLGQEEFRAILQSDQMEQLRQRVIAAYHLSPLDRSETRAYVEHRLKTAGWDNDPCFTDDAFERIHEATGGTPRLINNLCDRLMLFGYLEEIHSIDGKAVGIVAKEIREETVEPPPIANRAARTRAAWHAQERMGTPQSTASAADTQGLAQRVSDLESEIESLKTVMRKERALLRKAIIMTLDMDDPDAPLD